MLLAVLQGDEKDKAHVDMPQMGSDQSGRTSREMLRYVSDNSESIERLCLVDS